MAGLLAFMPPSTTVRGRMSRFLHSYSSRFTRGFSLAELMAVATILMILSSIAVGSYFVFRNTAEDTSAQTMLSDLEITQRFQYKDYGAYIGDPLDMEALEADNYTFVSGSVDSTGDTVVSIATQDSGKEVAMVSLSKSGLCYFVHLYDRDVSDPLFLAFTPADDGSADCDADYALTLTAASSGVTEWGPDA